MRIPRLFLHVIDPAQMYFDRVTRIPQEPAYRGGAVFGPGVTGGSRQATEDELTEFESESLRHREESAQRRQEVAARYVSSLDTAAETLSSTGRTVLRTPLGVLEARIVTFWRGDAVLEIRRRSEDGRHDGCSRTRLVGAQRSNQVVLRNYLANQLEELGAP